LIGTRRHLPEQGHSAEQAQGSEGEQRRSGIAAAETIADHFDRAAGRSTRTV
jgi:hypothetical protein